MNDIIAIIVCYFVFRALGGVLRALLGGERRNDFRRDRRATLHIFHREHYGLPLSPCCTLSSASI